MPMEDTDMLSFELKLKELINTYSKENDSDTPDYILAMYLQHCLESFNFAVNSRREWHSTENTKNWMQNIAKE